MQPLVVIHTAVLFVGLICKLSCVSVKNDFTLLCLALSCIVVFIGGKTGNILCTHTFRGIVTATMRRPTIRCKRIIHGYGTRDFLSTSSLLVTGCNNERIKSMYLLVHCTRVGAGLLCSVFSLASCACNKIS